ncbi:hypothetical protein HDV06_001913 [Boothiomyces sp. JEL0866]|nr:hypothetical protein HDV06_001913 [Boothiomyces sp. JEL0866]
MQKLHAQSTILESQWIYAKDCTGPPESIYVFNVYDLNENQPQPNETWPPFYNFTVSNGYAVGFCGNYPSYNPNNCCYQSLDISPTTGSNGYLSGSPYLLSAESFTLNSLPQQANGYSYCKLHASDNESLSGYLDLLYLAGEDCTDGYFKCSLTKDLYVFPDYGCSNTPTIYSLASKQHFLDSTLGSFTGEFLTVENGSVTPIWTAIVPWVYLIPDTLSVWDLLQHIMFLLTFIGFISILTYTLKRYFQNRTTNFRIIIVCQCIWIIYTSLFMYFQYTSFQSLDTFLKVMELTYTLQNLATLGSVIQTAYCLYKVQIVGISKKFLLLSCIAVFTIHLALAGSHYFMYCTYGDAGPLCISVDLLNLWLPISFYWYIFVLFWDTLPPLYLSYVVTLDQDSNIKRLISMVNTDMVYTLCWAVHFGVIFLYYCFVYLQFGSSLFSNDRAYNAVLAILNFLFSAHAIMSIVITARFKTYKSLLKKKKKSLQDYGTEQKSPNIQRSTVMSSVPTAIQ